MVVSSSWFLVGFLVGGWTNPFENMLVNLDQFPKVRGQMKNVWVATTQKKRYVHYIFQKCTIFFRRNVKYASNLSVVGMFPSILCKSKLRWADRNLGGSPVHRYIVMKGFCPYLRNALVSICLHCVIHPKWVIYWSLQEELFISSLL